ncbi:STAS domain-containing protein [Ruegeria sp. 2205SS24-7]|uniref:STAS domain-containing protein n=1 Tax=Ruegeria discodermiae TaxID=3064389 RepID=UPI002741466E|nr:STAS domain-containing protein [Ruegeria sp. 2205SS24-7]MDP5220806.1 STAS domain-containing protein [Ruegeria sp. 2205SS24-7]
MEISIENAGPYNSVRLYGQLDSKGAGSIYDTIVELGSLGPGKVIISVAGVTHATRAGCRALIVAAKMLHARTGEKLLVYDASPELVTILRGAGFDHLIVIYPSQHPLAAFAA